MAAIRSMTLGEVVDICIEFNKRNKPQEEGPKTRKATQSDWDYFFG